MRKLFAAFLLSGILFSGLQVQAQDKIPSYQFDFQIKGLKDTSIFMANYYGKRQYYKDTTEVDGNGRFRFEGKDLAGGVYTIILPDKATYFEFVVNEPSLSLETEYVEGDRSSLVKNMKVKDSKENEQFFIYLQAIEGWAAEAGGIRKKIEALDADSLNDHTKEKEAHQAELRKVDKAVKDYKNEFIDKNADLFITKVFKTSRDPEISDYEEIEDKKERELKRYVEFKKAYLENIDLTDERLLRSPVMHQRVQYYMKQLTIQHPDSMVKSAIEICERADANQEVFKYWVHTLTNDYANSKVMGFDAIYVAMAERYYCSGRAYWVDEEKRKEICDRAMAQKPLLIGKKAPELVLSDTTGKWHSLHKTQSPYTVLIFWDSGCGHCKKMMPKLQKFWEDFRSRDIVTIYAVGTELDNDKWEKFIKEKNLDWLNVSDTPEYPQAFRTTYDIFSTPQVYLLDKDKKIVAKKLEPTQLGEFIEHQLKNRDSETGDSK